MASYIPQVTDTFPQYQPFTPNFDFYNQALQVKHSQYQQGFKQLNSVYSSALNMPLSRQENIDRRDQFFKDTDNAIKKLSGLDLSLPQNVEAATQIFEPMFEDKYIMRDMVVTRSAQNAMQQHEALKACVGKDCGEYRSWDTGMKAVNYKLEEFKNSGSEESLNFGKIDYTPFYNISEEAYKFFKDNKFEVKRDDIKNGYVFTYKNGALLEEPLANMLKTMYENDSNVTSMFDTMAYVSRKDFSKANAQFFGSEQLAEREYLISNADQLSKGLNKQLKSIDVQLNGDKEEFARLTAKIRTQGLNPNSQEAERYRSLSQMIPVLEKAKTNLSRNLSYFDDLSQVDLNTLRNRIDSVVSNEMFTSQIRQVAKSYADATSEVSMKPDEYSLASFKSNLDFQKSVALAKLNHKFDLEKEDYKIRKGEESKLKLLGYGERANVTTSEPGLDNQVQEPLYETNSKTVAQTVDNYMGEMKTIMNQVYTDLRTKALAGDTVAKRDFEALFPGNKPDQTSFDKFYSWAKGKDTYENKYNSVLNYIKNNNPQLYQNNLDKIKSINSNKRIVDAMGKLNAENNIRIKSTMSTGYYSQLDEDLKPLVKDFFDKNNNIANRDSFTKSLKGKGYSEEDAGEAYDELLEEYQRQYSDGTRPESFRAKPYMGEVIENQGGGAIVNKPVFVSADPVKKLSEDYAIVNSVLQDISNTGFELAEGSPFNISQAQQLIRDFRANYDPEKENKGIPNVTMKYEATSDKKGYARVTLTPDSKWLENNLVGKDKEEESAKYSEASKGIQFYIPKDKANNLVEAGTKSFTDIIFETNDNIINVGKPGDREGNAVIVKDPELRNYSLTLRTPYIIPGTEEVFYKTTTTTVDGNRDANSLLSSIEMAIQKSELMLNEHEARKNRMKDPQEIINPK